MFYWEPARKYAGTRADGTGLERLRSTSIRKKTCALPTRLCAADLPVCPPEGRIQGSRQPVAPNFMYYNFVRIHKSLHVTPAIAAGVTDHLWKIEDIVKLGEERESVITRKHSEVNQTYV